MASPLVGMTERAPSARGNGEDPNTIQTPTLGMTESAPSARVKLQYTSEGFKGREVGGDGSGFRRMTERAPSA